MIEFERIFLAKKLPDNLQNCKSKEIIDIYLPHDSEHPKLRVRKNGDKYEITKKEVIGNGVYNEQTISLTSEEFNSVSSIKGKKLHKLRYFYPYQGRELEIGVFQGDLKGLVLIDVEFKSEEDMKNFKEPDFFLKEVVNKGFLAGGKLCGKKYEEIENFLNEQGYKRL